VVVSGCQGCARPAGNGANGAAGGQSEMSKILRDIDNRLKKLEERKQGASFSPEGDFISEAPAPARITVRLPADAKLYVDQVFCPLTSETRTFDTPTLEGGREYYYTLRAEVTRDGQRRQETQRVTVAPGRRVTVEFRNFTPLQTARR
jgi:uncharacterized protein (TIGR03000 family)